MAVEDLHWVDEQTQALLDGLVEGLPGARMALLATYRPEYRHGWAGKSYYTQLSIEPLPSASATALLDALLGEDGSLAALKHLLIERTGGNPFFLEESVRSLVEIGALAGKRGAYRLATHLPDVRLPVTVQTVLAARVDRLLPEDKRLLQTAAVIGKDVPLPLLRAVAGWPEDDVRAGLARLQAAEFLYQTTMSPEPDYTFKHALTQEAAYGGLLQERRRTLHRGVLESIERLYPDRVDHYAERLAYHALRGQAWDRAVVYSRQSGTRAQARSANREAVGHFEQALAALAHLPPDDRRQSEHAIDLRFDLRTALWSLGEHERGLEYLRQAERLAEAAADRRRLGWAWAHLAGYLRASGDHRRAIETGERAIAAGAELGDLSLQVMATDGVTVSYHESGLLVRAIELARTNVASLAGPLAHERWGQYSAPAVTSRAVLAWCLSWRGEFPEAIAHAEEALRIAEAIRHPQTTIDAYQVGGLVYVIKGEASRAIQWLEQALAIRDRMGHRWAGLGATAFSGPAYTLAGRAAEAIAMGERALEEAAMIGFRPCTSVWTVWLAGAYLLAGRRAEAEQAAARGLNLARAHRERGFEAYAHHQLGHLAERTEPLEATRVRDHHLAALAIAEELSMRPLQAHCHLGLGRLYRRIGRTEQARTELTAAVEMLREMEMTFWLPEAEGELAEATAAAPTRSAD